MKTGDQPPTWIALRALAVRYGVSKSTAQRRAVAEGLQLRRTGNRIEVRVASARQAVDPASRFLSALRPAERVQVLVRLLAVEVVEHATHDLGLTAERALAWTIGSLSRFGAFQAISQRSIQRWRADFAASGILGIAPRRRGRCGRKPKLEAE